jgi:hypothetical protein
MRFRVTKCQTNIPTIEIVSTSTKARRSKQRFKTSSGN